LKHLSRGSSGLGKELAKQLYQEGFNIILVSKNETKLTETKEEILLEELIPLPVSTGSPNNNKNSKSNNTAASLTTPVVIPKRNNDIQTISCDLENSFSPFLLYKELKKRNLESKVSFHLLHSLSIVFRSFPFILYDRLIFLFAMLVKLITVRSLVLQLPLLLLFPVPLRRYRTWKRRNCSI
jgi:hypothetical protein